MKGIKYFESILYIVDFYLVIGENLQESCFDVYY